MARKPGSKNIENPVYVTQVPAACSVCACTVAKVLRTNSTVRVAINQNGTWCNRMVTQRVQCEHCNAVYFRKLFHFLPEE